MKQDRHRIKNFLYSRVSSGDRGYAEWYGCCYEENQVQPVDLSIFTPYPGMDW